VALAHRSAADWAAALNAAGVPAGEILSVPEILGHPQITERRFIKRFVGTPGAEREVAVVRAGFCLASGDPHVVTPPPELGAHTRSVLQALGITDDEINSLQTDEIT
jgi:formyl-CoA transferase